MKKRLVLVVMAISVVTASVAAYYRASQTDGGPGVMTARVTRGDVIETVDATGTLQAVRLSTTFVVLQAQRDLATAQTNELRAQLDYRRALVDFDLAQESA